MNKPKLLIEPSHWLQDGIQLEVPADLPLFKSSERLQARSDALLLKSKAQPLSQEEQAELDSLTELSQIFTYLNNAGLFHIFKRLCLGALDPGRTQFAPTEMVGCRDEPLFIRLFSHEREIALLNNQQAVEQYLQARQQQPQQIRQENEARLDPNGIRDRLNLKISKD